MFRRARDLAGTVFPGISEASIHQVARKNGIGRKFGRVVIFSDVDIQRLYDSPAMPLKLVKRPRSPFWIIRGSIRGVRVEESTGADVKAVAEVIRAKPGSRDHHDHRPRSCRYCHFCRRGPELHEKTENTRFLNRVTSTSAPRCYRRSIRTPSTGWRASYPNASDATRNRQTFTPAVAVLWSAARRGWCAAPLIERPRASEERIRWLTLEEANRLLDACSPHLQPLLLFLLTACPTTGRAPTSLRGTLDHNRRQASVATSITALAKACGASWGRL